MGASLLLLPLFWPWLTLIPRGEGEGLTHETTTKVRLPPEPLPFCYGHYSLKLPGPPRAHRT